MKLKRIREGKTNYKKRYKLVLSGKPRLVVRKKNNLIIAQIVEYIPKGDKVHVTLTTRHLRKLGYKGHLNNLPAAYLLGYYIGKIATKKGFNEVILDIGLHTPHHGGALFAVLKGAVDAGMKIPHDEVCLPSEERIRGEHIKNYALLLKEQNPEKYKKQFSKYLERGLPPENIVEHFEEIKSKIDEVTKWVYLQ